MLINNKIKQWLWQNWWKHTRKDTEKLTNSKLRQYEVWDIDKWTPIKNKNKKMKPPNKYNIGDIIFVNYFDIKKIKWINWKFVEYGWSSFSDKEYIAIDADKPIPCVSFNFKVRITKLRLNKTKTKYKAYWIISWFGKLTDEIIIQTEDEKQNLIKYINKFLLNREIQFITN